MKMKPRQLVKTYEDNLEKKKECEIKIKELHGDIVSEKRTIDRLLKSIQLKTKQISFKQTSLNESSRFIEANKMTYMDCKVSTTALDKLLKQHEKIQAKIEKTYKFNQLFGK